jgi:hypothetical protein
LKDSRYKAVKSLIETKKFDGLLDVFTIIPISVVKDDLKVNYNTLRRRINKTELLSVKDIMQLSELFEVQPEEVFKLSLLDYNKQRKVQKKKS